MTTITCMQCELTITVGKNDERAREKFRAMGWQLFASGNGQCPKCVTERQHAECQLQIKMKWEGDIAEMVSPHMVQ